LQSITDSKGELERALHADDLDYKATVVEPPKLVQDKKEEAKPEEKKEAKPEESKPEEKKEEPKEEKKEEKN
jgi:hypothetical protein